jgi:hypothetical protein
MVMMSSGSYYGGNGMCARGPMSLTDKIIFGEPLPSSDVSLVVVPSRHHLPPGCGVHPSFLTSSLSLPQY